MVKIRLLLKSKAQYDNTIRELKALDVRLFHLGGYKVASGYGIAYWDDHSATDGISTLANNTEYTNKSEFIAAVKQLKGGV